MKQIGESGPVLVIEDGAQTRYVVKGSTLAICENALYITTACNDGELNNEIVSWNDDEVAEDPKLAFTIANAVARFFCLSPAEFAAIIGKRILPTGEVVLKP